MYLVLGIILLLVKIGLVLAGLLLGAGWLTLGERRLLGWIQIRLGPNRAGPWGLLQPAADIVKLLTKEDLVPRGADRWIFLYAPALVAVTALLIFAVVPFSSTLTFMGVEIPMVISDLNVGLLFVIALSSISVYGIVLGDWASNSKLSLLGGIRAAAAFVGAGGETCDIALFRWFGAGDLQVTINVHYDGLAAIMVLMVTFVASVVHLYSVSFMRQDRDYVRYFSFLNLFVFSMLVISLADDLIFVYLGWEGVGFCSYGMIGFWYEDPGKATLLTLLLLWAALGKSAQLPLTVWLPDAMAGPTPVSALIHAATMVTAGVYLLMRLFPMIQQSPQGMMVIAFVGAVTAFYSALAALAQRDIKRVLAYSTISQVGYMFLAVGAGDILSGMFHLLSHAFFKSLLFLAAGCIIQALAEEHYIFRMGNLRRHLPSVFWLMLAGALCLSAFPTLGGYFSKDRILLSTFIHPGAGYKFFWALGISAAFLVGLVIFLCIFLSITSIL